MKLRTAAAVLAFAASATVAPEAAYTAEAYRLILPEPAGDPITLTGHDLTIEQLAAIARQGQPVEISPEVRDHQADARSLLLEGLAEGVPIQGFEADRAESQARLAAAFRHVAVPGAPEIMDEAVVRAAMAVRANTLVYQPVTAPVQQMLLDFLNDRITPVVAEPGGPIGPGQGPMANIAAAMAGFGDVYYRGTRMPASRAINEAGLTPVSPADFDDRGLIDTDAFEIARTALLADRGRRALEWADIIFAMDMLGLSASPAPLSLPAQANRPYQWSAWNAARVLALIKGSYLFDGEPGTPPRTYPESLAPSLPGQGAAWLAWGALRDTVLVALNSSDQSPVFRVGLSPRESRELGTAQMMKFYVKGGAIEGGKKGFVVPATNQSAYPLTLMAASFAEGLGELSSAVAHRIPNLSTINPGDHAGLSGALDALDRLLADDIGNAVALMDGQAKEYPGRQFGEVPAAVWADFHAAPGGGQSALDFLRTRQAASYMPDAEPPPGADAPIPLAQEKIRR
ncbi:MAG TPA: aromatic amino acid lyase [Alphaproteobacteria bacterium]|nr:aromatic amino acid lyase [Alphaproteobacteria bacterium]